MASLIIEEVAAGELDVVSGLIYRALVALGLPGLPDRFRSGTPMRDDTVFAQMAVLSPTLSAEDQARLHPFLARPTDTESVFAPQPAALVSGALQQEEETLIRCRDWVDSGDADARFKVWACADDGTAGAQSDIATIVAMVKQIWEPMTKDGPQGMGDPVPDEDGGDQRIDFYAVKLGLGVYRDHLVGIPSTAAAVAYAAAPFFHADGSPRKSTSGFVLVNRDRIEDQIKFQQDLIHEFFHVLQYAHNVVATHDDLFAHWFNEASAVWAETFYDTEHSDIPHAWYGVFQSSIVGLEVGDPTHHYADYIWPFFMEQELDETAIFNAWEAIEPIAAGDFNAVTSAISGQLPFETHFREFAVRNLNLPDVLGPAGEPLYIQQDRGFIDALPPAHITGYTLRAGEPYVSDPGGPPPLAAEYYKFGVAPSVKEITVSLANLSPADQLDGDVLMHVIGGTWQRQQIQGGVLTLCRDKPEENVDELYLVLSNHSAAAPILGFFESSAKEACEDKIRLAGDLTWNEQIVKEFGSLTVTETASGSAHIVAEWDATSAWTVLGDSHYTVDFSISNCSPGGHFSGPIYSSTDTQAPPQGSMKASIDGGPGEDLSIVLTFASHWMASCDFGGGPGDPQETSASHAFPGCSRINEATALFDGDHSYVFNCEPAPDMLGSTSTASGQVAGTLSTEEVATPAP